ncbi:ankyrin repeat domain-containing protein [Wolbachia endosymbiont of Folsomia candida]|uniref:ankyrin repeat domain-containing protein n=1 Tax=Wolbachia endosymbiont of Folsomia candida TaxID=169402 RepID=UPI000AA22419|nr:ankyrin repeat domain-containing protein [Wolbachia endosymbiont of Folsomia candida]APR99127.1 hypothetical protein ASM33_08090 [Wolbachia endosymbiont of Folsomia candida]
MNEAEQKELNRELYINIIKVDVERVLECIEAGADVNKVPLDMMGTPICTAAQRGNECIINALIKAGANVNFQGIYVSFDDMKAGIDFSDKDIKNLTPLHIAAKEGHNNHVIDILLDAGADLNVKDAHGMTPLDWTVKKGYTECSNTLILYTLLRDINGEKPDCVLKNSSLSEYWSSFQNMANKERMSMRDENIDGSNVTLDSVLFTKDENYLADLVSNTNMQECLKDREYIKKWEDAFFFYGDHIERIIAAQHNKGKERKDSLGILEELLRRYGSDKKQLDKLIKKVIHLSPQCFSKIINQPKEKTGLFPIVIGVDKRSLRELPLFAFNEIMEPFTMLTNVEIATLKKEMMC